MDTDEKPPTQPSTTDPKGSSDLVAPLLIMVVLAIAWWDARSPVESPFFSLVMALLLVGVVGRGLKRGDFGRTLFLTLAFCGAWWWIKGRADFADAESHALLQPQLPWTPDQTAIYYFLFYKKALISGLAILAVASTASAPLPRLGFLLRTLDALYSFAHARLARRVSATLVLDTTPDQLTYDNIQEGVARLRTISNDQSIRLLTVSTGSTKLSLDMLGRTYGTLRNSHERGELADLCGAKVLNVWQARRLDIVAPPDNLNAPVVLISNSPVDDDWRDLVRQHLGVLQIRGMIRIWDDQSIRPGDDIVLEAENAIRSAAVALLLVSANYLADDAKKKEALSLLSDREGASRRVCAVIVRSCALDRADWLEDIERIPTNGKALALWSVPLAEKELASLVDDLANFLQALPLPSTVLPTAPSKPIAMSPRPPPPDSTWRIILRTLPLRGKFLLVLLSALVGLCASILTGEEASSFSEIVFRIGLFVASAGWIIFACLTPIVVRTRWRLSGPPAFGVSAIGTLLYGLGLTPLFAYGIYFTAHHQVHPSASSVPLISSPADALSRVIHGTIQEANGGTEGLIVACLLVLSLLPGSWLIQLPRPATSAKAV